MSRKTSGSLLALLGLAGIAALGAILGRETYRGLRAMHDEDDDTELAHRDTLAGLIERFAATLPDNEAEIMLRRNRSRLRDW